MTITSSKVQRMLLVSTNKNIHSKIRTVYLANINSRTYFDKATAYIKAGFYLTGVDYLHLALNQQPDVVNNNYNKSSVYYLLGIAYNRLGMYDEAVDAIYWAIRRRGLFADAYYLLGLTNDDHQRYDLAIEAYANALKIDRWHAHAQYGLQQSKKALAKQQRAKTFRNVIRRIAYICTKKILPDE